jgi:hypothetical protein
LFTHQPYQITSKGETDMKKPLVYTTLVFAFATFMGCGDDWKAEISSDTSWSGSFGGASVHSSGGTTVAGRGSQKIDLPDDKTVCCVVRKLSSNGYLKVKIENEGGGPFGIFASEGRESQTTAPYGTVDVCVGSEQ